MKKLNIQLLALLVISSFVFTKCANPLKTMAERAKEVNYTVNPSPLEMHPDENFKERVAAFIHGNDMWLDLGKKENLVEAENLFEKIRNTYQV